MTSCAWPTSTGRTLGDCIRAIADVDPERVLFTQLADRAGEPTTLVARELLARATDVAHALAEVAARGDRVLLLFAPGLDFQVGFLACALGGFVAVPAYPPSVREGRPDKHHQRLEGIVANCAPRAALTTKNLLAVRAALPERSYLRSVAWIATDDLARGPGDATRLSPPSPDDIAFLQYTSGSTSEPKGVVLTHRNILENQAVIARKFEVDSASTMVTWLPVYHDMGLCAGFFLSLFTGCHSVLLSPVSFVMRPVRWLEAITRYRATISGGPNFAFDLCVSRVDDAVVPNLDLTSLRTLFSGAEPVHLETLERFAAKFAPAGFHAQQFYPCYGLAEATLFVSGGLPSEAPRSVRGRRDELGRGRFVEASENDAGAVPLVSCGREFAPHVVRIVDPETHVPRSEGEVGEIWVKSGSVGLGYYGMDELSQTVFRARTSDGEGPFLRTGDLGVLRDGELFVVGRVKDLVILNGVNHYPQDIERVVERAHPSLAENASAAFALTIGTRERLGVAVELARGAKNVDLAEVEGSVQRALANVLELEAHSIAILAPGALPRTSSGKIRRHACRIEHARPIGGAA